MSYIKNNELWRNLKSDLLSMQSNGAIHLKKIFQFYVNKKDQSEKQTEQVKQTQNDLQSSEKVQTVEDLNQNQILNRDLSLKRKESKNNEQESILQIKKEDHTQEKDKIYLVQDQTGKENQNMINILNYDQIKRCLDFGQLTISQEIEKQEKEIENLLNEDLKLENNCEENDEKSQQLKDTVYKNYLKAKNELDILSREQKNQNKEKEKKVPEQHQNCFQCTCFNNNLDHNQKQQQQDLEKLVQKYQQELQNLSIGVKKEENNKKYINKQNHQQESLNQNQLSKSYQKDWKEYFEQQNCIIEPRKTFTSIKFHLEKQNSHCILCDKDINKNESRKILSCLHKIHEKCYVEKFKLCKQFYRCPICDIK